MSNEQRRFARRSLNAEIRATDSDGVGELLFESGDLSTGGTFLRSDLLLEEGEALTLQFQVPGEARTLKAQARVAWVRRFPKEDENPGMGVEFLSMSDEDRAVLARFLEGTGVP